MTYRYSIRNTYRPSVLAPKAYGWSGGPNYNSADVPSRWIEDQTNITTDALKQQFAYEWFQSGEVSAGFSGSGGYSNPPFVSGAAGRLHPLLLDNRDGKPARILRGYIRRAEYDVVDPASKSRLYFMYNPETITRDYVSYLEQSALDPFNTVYQSGNLIAPPSIMNFSFELFFDRQEEAAQRDHPGVFVDYQFFDLVVRNVVPSDPNSMSNTLPDSGVMMVNPRDITVIFSPQLTVQGRPTNAQVVFEKFDHRMTPTRMRIRLTILASYFGPVKDMVEYKAEQLPPEESIPIDMIKVAGMEVTFLEIEDDSDSAAEGGTETSNAAIAAQLGQSNDANHTIRLQALAWAMANTNPGGPGAKNEMNPGWTNYTGANSGANRYNLPLGADCSGLVTEAYIRVGHGKTMGWQNHPGTSNMMSSVNNATSIYMPLSSFDWKTKLLPGDILIRNGHVGFFVGYSGTNCIIFDAASSTINPEVGQRTANGHSSFTHLLRPTPLGSVGSAAQASNYNNQSIFERVTAGTIFG